MSAFPRQFFFPAAFVFLLALAAGCGGGEGGPMCEYRGDLYEDGEVFPAGDGCNTCACNPSGDTPGEVECSGVLCRDGGGGDGGALYEDGD